MMSRIVLSEPLYYSPPVIQSSNKSYDAFDSAVIGLIIALVAVGLLYLAWTLFVKDCILIYKAKRQRTTTEMGFGQTPQHRGGVVRNNNVGNGGDVNGNAGVM